MLMVIPTLALGVTLISASRSTLDLLALLFTDDDQRVPYEEVGRRLGLPVGSIVGPVRSPAGFHVLKVVERVTAGMPTTVVPGFMRASSLSNGVRTLSTRTQPRAPPATVISAPTDV